mgnify:CR=1 FL=1
MRAGWAYAIGMNPEVLVRTCQRGHNPSSPPCHGVLSATGETAQRAGGGQELHELLAGLADAVHQLTQRCFFLAGFITACTISSHPSVLGLVFAGPPRRPSLGEKIIWLFPPLEQYRAEVDVESKPT